MPTRRPLSTKLLASTLATAAIAFMALVCVVIIQAANTTREQANDITRWSEQSAATGLFGDARLAKLRLDMFRRDVDSRFASLAKRDSIVRAVRSRDQAEFATLVQPAIRGADLSGVIAFDTDFRTIATDGARSAAEIDRANFAALPLAKAIADVLAGGSSTESAGFMRSMPAGADLRAALAIGERVPAVDVLGHAILDENGRMVAILVGFRLLSASEPALVDFTKSSGRNVIIAQDGLVVSSAARADLVAVSMIDRPGSRLEGLGGVDEVAACLPTEPDLQICATAPSAEIELPAAQLVASSERNAHALVVNLFLTALAAMALFTFVVLALARQISRPLTRITEVVAEVARGNWRMAVPGTARSDEVGSIARAVVILKRSLAERDALRGSIEIQNARFDAALNNMSQGLGMFDRGGTLVIANMKLAEIYRVAGGGLAFGQEIAAVGRLLSAPDGWPWMGSATTVDITPGIHCRRLDDGRIIEVSVQPMQDGGWVETHEDVTEAHRAQSRIAHMAMYDALTDLPNRTLFNERLSQALDRAEDVAVLCLDLDDFKGINDTLGHGAGDELLREVADRLQSHVPPGATVARLGGDEFAVLLHDAGAAGETASAVLASFRYPIPIAGQLSGIGVSIGLAAAQPGSDAVSLMRQADVALYAAKAQGGHSYVLFDPAMEERLHQRKWMERELRLALASGDIGVHYQPIYDILDERVAGFEALARWTHPERGAISPAEFIPLAEQVGLIDQMGERILTRACHDAAAWPVPVRIAVNISAVQARNPGFCELVAAILMRSGLDPRRLELEITESVVLGDDPDILGKLHRLRGLGIRFSMDDFGTGYSSLSSLRAFPFDKIKLDKSFVRDSLARSDCATIVRVVADLGRSLRMTTTAEGVETADQLNHLRVSGFCEAQGFLFSAAVPDHEVPRILHRPTILGRAA